MSAATISPRYQVMIPRDVRKSMKLRPGQRVEVIEDEGVNILVPVGDIRKLRGFLKGMDTTIERDEDRL